MGLEVFWTEFAVKEFRKIYDYYRRRASSGIAKKLVDGIYNETLKLASQPEIGQIEELLRGRDQEYRYLIYKKYKIIYWVNHQADKIEIVDVFDTRQNPYKMERIG